MGELEYIKSVADMQVSNDSLFSSPGLWYGQMGSVIFLSHYAKYTGDMQYEEYAIDNLGLILEGISPESQAGFAHGIAGIGAGIEYLNRTGLIDVDTDMILEDVDHYIFYRKIMRNQYENNGLENGFTGLGQYYLSRINCRQTPENELIHLSNTELMLHIVNIIEQTFSSSDPYLPDILSFLYRLYCLDVCNPKIERCMDKVRDVLSGASVCTGSQPELTLALLQTANIHNYIEKHAKLSVTRTLQNIASLPASLAGTDILFWLLRGKRIIRQTNLFSDLISQFDPLIERCITKIQGDSLDREHPSLKGSAGTALAMMTVSGAMNDDWLELLG